MASPTVDRRMGLVGNIALKAPVTVVATTNITLSGQQTIDGVAVLAINSAGAPDRVLCIAQSNPSQNGIWDVSNNAWTRSDDADGNYDLACGTMVLVTSGITGTGTVWKLLTTGTVTIGTTSQSWTRALTSDTNSLSFTALGTGALPRSLTGHLSDRRCILDFIPESEHAAILARTSTFDCHAAIVNAINSIYTGSGFFFSGAEVYFPPGRYRLLSTVNITRQTKLLGTCGPNSNNDGSSEISCPPGVGAFIVNAFNSDGLGVPAGSGSFPDPTFSASNSIIEGLRLIADVSGPLFFPVGHPVNPGANNTGAHAIRMRGACLVRNCLIFGFEGDGVHIVATAASSGEFQGNDNLFRLEGVAVERCAGNGVFVDGADVNAGYSSAISVIQNGLWGIFDSGFLGNTWIGCHANTNWSGDYKTDNVNAVHAFINCYSEIGLGPSNFSTSTLVVGGALAGGVTAGTRVIQAGGAGAGINLYSGCQTDFISLGLQNTTGGVLDTPRTSGFTWRWQDTTATTGTPSYWQWLRQVGRHVLQHANVGEYMHYYDNTATVANGYARNLTDAPWSSSSQIGINTHFFGGKADMKYRGLATAAPGSGEFLRGDIIWQSAPAASGKIGFACTTGGTAGSTAVFKAFGAIDP